MSSTEPKTLKGIQSQEFISEFQTEHMDLGNINTFQPI